MHKVTVKILFLLFLIHFFSAFSFAQITLSGDNEVPVVTTAATGEISVAVDSNTA